MNEDEKIFLKEKLSALANDEELDKVAGGTYKENLEILNAMARLDFEGVQSIFAKVNDPNNPDSTEFTISQGAVELLEKHFYDGFGIEPYTSTEDNNWYRKFGREVSHAKLLKMINDKADAARG